MRLCPLESTSSPFKNVCSCSSYRWSIGTTKIFVVGCIIAESPLFVNTIFQKFLNKLFPEYSSVCFLLICRKIYIILLIKSISISKRSDDGFDSYADIFPVFSQNIPELWEWSTIWYKVGFYVTPTLTCADLPTEL